MTELTHKMGNRSDGILQREHVCAVRRGLPAARMWVLAAVLTGGCGGAPQPPDETTVHRLFAKLQVHEARQQEALLAHRRADECGERCQAGQDARQQAEQVCELADTLGDADAILRCRSARQAVPPDGECSCN